MRKAAAFIALTAAGILAAAPPGSSAQTCIDYRDFLHAVSWIHQGGEDVVVVGHYAYMP